MPTALHHATKFIPFALATLLSACASHPDIPAPIIQQPPTSSGNSIGSVTTPLQKAWNWEGERWFTAELDAGCDGTVRFVDQSRNIDSYVGEIGVPAATFTSDDPDVVLANISGFHRQLVFSTDGGRRFVKEVRGLPRGASIQFIAVRNSHVYVGVQQGYNEADGYFDWQRPGIRSQYQMKPPVLKTRLMILEAPLDKVRGRIGWYMLLAPHGHQFNSRYAEAARQFIKRVDNIESLGLPHSAGAPPADACDTTLNLPPSYSPPYSEALEKLTAWYEAAKKANPGWTNAKSQSIIDKERARLMKNKN
ncbi:hypothetical protein [Pseudoduganella sp. HUAS MS19]